MLLGGADLRMGAPRGRESRASTSGTSLSGTRAAINPRGGPVALCLDEMRSNIMPLDLIWLVAVVTAFVIFAGTLYWADHRTRELNK